MKKSIVIMLMSIIIALCGCSDNVDEYKQFSDYIDDKEYLYALSVYDKNKENADFKSKADDLIYFEIMVVNSNLEENNLRSAKKFRDLAEEILGRSSIDELDTNIEKKEKEISAKKNVNATNDTKDSEEKDVAETSLNSDKKEDKEIKTGNDDASNEDFKYVNYENSKYGYKIKYPDYLKGITSSKSEDEIELLNSETQVKLIIRGANNTSNTTVDSSYKKYLGSAEGVTYKYSNKSMYVVSGIQSNGMSYYHYEAIGQGSINSFTFYWPTKDTQYKPVVEELYNSFKTPSLDKTH